MALRAVMIRGNLSQDEFNRIVALVREIDTDPDRLIQVQIIDPDITALQAREMIEGALPDVAGRVVTETTVIPNDRALDNAQLKLAAAGVCPDCDMPRRLIDGPSGGIGRNRACERCGAEFNVATYGGVPVWGERLTPFGEPNLDRLRRVYGIKL